MFKNSEKIDFEIALDKTGFGKYNICLLIACCLQILAMYMDIFGFSIILPSVACDMGLSTSQQGLLSAMPLIGVMISSYAWGLCADTLGRRITLLVAMPIGLALSLVSGIAPTYASLATLKFLSAAFSSSANAAAFVLLGESVPPRLRNKFMFLMASATMYVQLVLCVIALGVYQLSFNIYLPIINIYYRPWRLILQLNTLPGIIGTLGVIFLNESPKFLLSNGKEEEAIAVLKSIHRWNKGSNCEELSISTIHLDEDIIPVAGSSLLEKIWNQTVPLFKPPLLKNSLILYYIILCAYMTATGYTMWIPTVTNAFFNGEDNANKTFCEVASTATSANKTDCNNTIKLKTYYAVMLYSGISGSLNVLLTFLVGPLGKKTLTILVFAVSISAGTLLFFVKQPIMNIALFFLFLYVALILGNVNTYLVEVNPTHLRGMATCLSVVVARGFGFFSVQIIAILLADHCVPLIGGYIALVLSGLLVAIFLPTDRNGTSEKNFK
ncbi:putative transporter svop-1 [Zerene cesonia]|uniref:putative transporter svop-1 n=1 Tax=Zerene cesonia TaxID=33412 RepID=UPI0018E50CB1|nr:putative transporter svop-1 [Zerene cesonia]